MTDLTWNPKVNGEKLRWGDQPFSFSWAHRALIYGASVLTLGLRSPEQTRINLVIAASGTWINEFLHNFLSFLFFLLEIHWYFLLHGSVFQNCKLVSCHEFHWFTCFTLCMTNLDLPQFFELHSSFTQSLRKCGSEYLDLRTYSKIFELARKEVICKYTAFIQKQITLPTCCSISMKYLCCHKAIVYQ